MLVDLQIPGAVVETVRLAAWVCFQQAAALLQNSDRPDWMLLLVLICSSCCGSSTTPAVQEI